MASYMSFIFFPVLIDPGDWLDRFRYQLRKEELRPTPASHGHPKWLYTLSRYEEQGICS